MSTTKPKSKDNNVNYTITLVTDPKVVCKDGSDNTPPKLDKQGKPITYVTARATSTINEKLVEYTVMAFDNYKDAFEKLSKKKKGDVTRTYGEPKNIKVEKVVDGKATKERGQWYKIFQVDVPLPEKNKKPETKKPEADIAK
jgi:hypothetical protein